MQGIVEGDQSYKHRHRSQYTPIHITTHITTHHVIWQDTQTLGYESCSIYLHFCNKGGWLCVESSVSPWEDEAYHISHHLAPAAALSLYSANVTTMIQTNTLLLLAWYWLLAGTLSARECRCHIHKTIDVNAGNKQWLTGRHLLQTDATYVTIITRNA